MFLEKSLFHVNSLSTFSSTVPFKQTAASFSSTLLPKTIVLVLSTRLRMVRYGLITYIKVLINKILESHAIFLYENKPGPKKWHANSLGLRSAFKTVIGLPTSPRWSTMYWVGRQTLYGTLFHCRTRTAYVYNGCRVWRGVNSTDPLNREIQTNWGIPRLSYTWN